MNQKENGFIFLEILIAVGLISITFILLLSMGVQSMTLSRSIGKTVQINSLIKEEIEAVRSFRDGTLWTTTGLGIVATGDANPYHLVLDTQTNPPQWKLESGVETVGDVTRKVIFDKVSRDSSTKAIEATYNDWNDDPDTRKVTVVVSYAGKDYQIVTYMTNWHDN